MGVELLAVVVVVAGAIGVVVVRSLRVIRHGSAAVVERLGAYHRTLTPGMNLVVPFIDRVRDVVDMREMLQPFPPQPVTTADNLLVSVDTLVFYQVTDARAATYEVANYVAAMEQLIATTLRNVIGEMDLDTALRSREDIAARLRTALADTTQRWGIRIRRVELKAVDPPAAIQEAMEKQMRAERDKQAAIAAAQGERQAAILAAEGEKKAAVLRAEGEAEAVVVRAQAEARAEAMRAKGQADAIGLVFRAVQEANPDQRLLAYQYLRTLPEIAKGEANKVWIVPSEMGKALENLGLFTERE
ncbi:SPFH domain-containing protein [Thermoactinospora rubra]|uniref:SPFH domain-containing protein n=1 Tax=Thermoactinospora rubra TaxID=1088767 RepID=UPI000A1117F8|nr:SPFH domain-containing protein [Thermoactinospora rubra]